MSIGLLDRLVTLGFRWASAFTPFVHLRLVRTPFCGWRTKSTELETMAPFI